ncbi:MAG: MOSC domain-containing protein [Pseudomonadota bacterium]
MQNKLSGMVNALWSYPIKGFTPIEHQKIDLKKGQGVPGDRLFGFAKGNSGFDPSNPKPLPKDRFLVLMQHAKIAGWKTEFDPQTYTLRISNDGGILVDVNLRENDGQARMAAFFVEHLELSEEERPFFASAQPHRFTDVSVVSETYMNAVSFINLASVRDFEIRTGLQIDPARFRANIIMNGLPPFAEFELIDHEIKLGDVTFKVLKRTKRCAATEVNPATAERDIKLPALLRKTYGHFDMGVYAEVISDGAVCVGDPVSET